MYQIEDLQIPGRLFADGATFETHQDIYDQLYSYHETDYIDEDGDRAIMPDMPLDELLGYGQWSIIETKFEGYIQ